MTKISRTFLFIFNIFFAVGVGLLIFFLRNFSFNIAIKYLIIGISILVFGAINFGLITNNSFFSRISTLSAIIILFGLLSYYIALKYNFIQHFNDIGAIKALISKYHSRSALIFIAIQFLQVTIIPIPSAITTVAGVAIFGVWKTVLFSSVGVILGSMFAFFLGRVFGVKLVVWICGEKLYNNYQKIVKGRDKFILFLMFLLPFFPDDILCIIAGMTTLSYKEFFIMMLIVRPITIFVFSFAFNGLFKIPLVGWGIPIWILIISATICLFALCWKYSEQLQESLIAVGEKFQSIFAKIFRLNIENKKTVTNVQIRRSAYSPSDKSEAKNKKKIASNAEKINYKEFF